jgi:predicted dithiol-disulfide oxidoreductase (DUF899 family)
MPNSLFPSNRHLIPPMKSTLPIPPAIVSPEAWLAARLDLLREEKEFTRLSDRLAARRRALPWVAVERDYVFASPEGPVSLAELFAGRGQLIVQHFMMGPGWDEGCGSCSFMMDHFESTLVHLAARDVSFAAISRAPIDEIVPFRRRMGWSANWVSSYDNTFNRDFRVSFTPAEIASGAVDYNFGRRPFPKEEAPGISVFARDVNGVIYRTYSTYGRGVETVMATYRLLDLVPKGRDEDPEAPMNWVRHHDRYDHAVTAR